MQSIKHPVEKPLGLANGTDNDFQQCVLDAQLWHRPETAVCSASRHLGLGYYLVENCISRSVTTHLYQG